MPSDHACTYSQLYPLYLARYCCWSSLTSFGSLTGPEHDGNFYIATGCSMARHPTFTRAEEHIKRHIILHWKCHSLAPELEGFTLCVAQWGLPQTPWATFLINTFNTIDSGKLNGTSDRAACTTAWTCCWALFYSRSHLKLAAFYIYIYIWAREPEKYL